MEKMDDFKEITDYRAAFKTKTDYSEKGFWAALKTGNCQTLRVLQFPLKINLVNLSAVLSKFPVLYTLPS